MSQLPIYQGGDKDIRFLLSLWAEWALSGGAIRSSIGYPRSTVEARIVEGILVGGGPAGPIVPIHIQGVEESRIHKAVMSMPDRLWWALTLKHLWTQVTGASGYVRVTDDMRARRWAYETGANSGRRCFLREVEKAETWVAGHISNDS